MGSSWDFYETWEEERERELLVKRANSAGRTTKQQIEYELLISRAYKGRKLYLQQEEEKELIEIFLANRELVEK